MEQQIETIERQGFGYEPFEWVEDFGGEEEEFEKNLKKRKFIVKEVLEGYDKATNDDAILTLECWRTEFEEIKVTSTPRKDGDIIFRIPKHIAKHLPPPESYRRARQALIHEAIKNDDYELLKRIMPQNPIVFEKRCRKEKIIREYFRGQGL